VVYPPGVDTRDPAIAGVLKREIAVELPDTAQPQDWAARNAVSVVRKLSIPGDWYLVKPHTDELFAALDAADAMLASGATPAALPQIAYAMRPRLTPNDPLFGLQWHLENTGQFPGAVQGIDMNVTGIWDSVTGNGVQIAVVDSGIDTGHDDLQANIRFDLHRDILDGDDNPIPQLTAHGVAVAGIAAARGDNGIGVTGTAFDADIVAVRLIDGVPTTDAQQAEAMTVAAFNSDPASTVDVSNNSWGPPDIDFLASKFPAGPLLLHALDAGTRLGRGGLGVVYVWAAGNGRQFQNNVNYDGFASSRYSIAVGGIGSGDGFASFSEPGVSMLVTAPSGDDGVNIVTTDQFGADNPDDLLLEFEDGFEPTGNYTASFDGTSASTPMVSGAVALILDQTPGLGWRDIQNILVDTAVKTDPSQLQWFENESGRSFNPNYGFGRVDAKAAVDRASFWANVPRETVLTKARFVNAAVPDGSSSGIASVVAFDSSDFPVPEEDPPIASEDVDDIFDFFVEHVEVVFNASHPQIGHLSVTLISPSGTPSQLAVTNPDTADAYVDYVFTSNAHWGEEPDGDWTLIVSDTIGGIGGQFDGWTLRIYGYLIDRRTVFILDGWDSFEHGTFNRPFNTLEEAAAVVAPGGTCLVIGGGTFTEVQHLDTALRIEGTAAR